VLRKQCDCQELSTTTECLPSTLHLRYIVLQNCPWDCSNVNYTRAQLQAALLVLGGEFLQSLDPPERTEALGMIIGTMAKALMKSAL
jgi:hypothetical protein